MTCHAANNRFTMTDEVTLRRMAKMQAEAERAAAREWFESLLACIQDGEIENAKDIIQAAIKRLSK